jgi:Tol biopolymer transport system component
VPLVSGTRLGAYEVTAQIGEGGMGEVYRARDTKLNRDVALKILPAPFATDPERLARFKREAQVLAALDHPNIGAIYGFEDADGTHALVLQLVDGPTLSDRIAQGPIPIDEALAIAKQIADALEAAHEQGIIHRDLKPANIKVTPDGRVKVLDFGLAKLLETDAAGSARSAMLTNSPTITTPAMTMAGMILGTAAYMSPEQAKGRAADKRSDLWAFGCVLYETLTGTRAFDGEDISDTLAFVLTKQPSWDALPKTTPPTVRTLLRRCLEKDRKRRLADASDARLEIDEAIAAPFVETPGPAATSSAIGRRSTSVVAMAAIGVFVLGALVAGGAVWKLKPSTAATPGVVRFTIPLPADQKPIEFGHQLLAISPDGQSIVYAANRRLYLKSMSDSEAKPLAGSEVTEGQFGAPTFSPDGQRIVYLAGSGIIGDLKVIPVNGGVPTTICEKCASYGNITWDESGIVTMGPRAQGGSKSTIVRVPPDGGTPQQLLTVSDGLPWDPQLLPGGDAVLFTLSPASSMRELGGFGEWDKAQVVVQSLKSGERKPLIDGGAAARYVSSGHLLYARGGVLLARRFDPRRLEVAPGAALTVVEGVKRPVFTGQSQTPGTVYYAVSASGSLVYFPGPASTSSQNDLALLDQEHGISPLKLRPAPYAFPRVSPDGKSVAVEVDDGRDATVWVYELSGATSIRQLTTKGRNRFPVWSADSREITFQSDRDGDLALFSQLADGSRTAERLTTPDTGTAHVPNAWSPISKTLLFEIIKDMRRSLWAFSVSDGKTVPVGDETGLYAIDAAFSTDGRWIAYRTSGRGRSAVGVEPFPFNGTKTPVAEGIHPTWSWSKPELVFRQLTTGDFMATTVTTSPSFKFSPPRPLPINLPERVSNSGRRNHDVLPDGRIITVVAVGGQSQLAQANPQIHVVLNWFEELKQRVPVK